VPTRLLRYYEKQGLLHASRDGNVYRVYGEPAFKRVLMIRELLESGFTTELRASHWRTTPIPQPPTGKIVIDAGNYYPDRDGLIPELEEERTTTSELLQAHLPHARVVKAFNHIPAAALTADEQPRGSQNRRALILAGDDPAARVTVSTLIDEFGFDPLDIGELAEGWRVERGTPAYMPGSPGKNSPTSSARPSAIATADLRGHRPDRPRPTDPPLVRPASSGGTDHPSSLREAPRACQALTGARAVVIGRYRLPPAALPRPTDGPS
jgi:hypothetical protein